MGTIKFEIDLPEFEKQLTLNITINRDGNVVYSSFPPSIESSLECEKEEKTKESKSNPTTTPKKKSSRVGGGNLMDISDF
jgi:hypothetical protein